MNWSGLAAAATVYLHPGSWSKLAQVVEDNHTGYTVQMAGHAGTAATAHTSTAAEAELEDEGGMAAVGPQFG